MLRGTLEVDDTIFQEQITLGEDRRRRMGALADL